MSEQLTVRLPEELSDALEAAAKRLRRKRSEVVRMALEQFLRIDHEGSPGRGVSNLLGSLETGVPDLAARHREYVLEKLKRDG